MRSASSPESSPGSGGAEAQGMGDRTPCHAEFALFALRTETFSSTSLEVGAGIFLWLPELSHGRIWWSRQGKQEPKAWRGVHLSEARGGPPAQGLDGLGLCDLSMSAIFPHPSPPARGMYRQAAASVTRCNSLSCSTTVMKTKLLIGQDNEPTPLTI